MVTNYGRTIHHTDESLNYEFKGMKFGTGDKI